jgi:PilZ domain
MEHRWGERVPVHLTVELSRGAAAPVVGLLDNVSSSGAFVRTEGRLPRGAVEVALVRTATGRDSFPRLPAYIVRESELGVGIEWCEFAPRAVRELMDRGRSTAVRTRRRHVSARRGPNESNMTLQPLAPPDLHIP